ncbi:MAG: gluconate 2-dehydrogenase subunit 3 family protein [Leeuwenhoekiella sp.]
MNRRQVIRNLGLGAGYMVAAPSLFNLLQSCKSDPTLEWEPVFLTATNGYVLKQVLDVIIPKTDTPGANDLNIAQFIDSYMNEVADPKEQQKFKAGANAFSLNFKSTFDKDAADGKAEDFEKITEKYLRAAPEDRKNFVERLTAKQDPQNPEIDIESGSYGYLTSVRELAIWAWKNSEAIGENVMWYDPIPGSQKGCVPFSEAGNGKAMSL